MDFVALERLGAITHFSPADKERRQQYLAFHEVAYREDLAVAEQLRESSHRWSIVAAYYAMLNVTKLYLAKHHNLMIAERSHLATRVALEHVLTDKEVRERALSLLVAAEREFDSFTAPSRKKEAVLPAMLSAGRRKREKASYYSEPVPQHRATEVTSFFQATVKPFITIMEGLV